MIFGDKARAINGRHDGEPMRPGFPIEEPLKTRAEIESYFATDEIVCLFCGFEYGMLCKHLKFVHGVSVREYQDLYGLPRRGLVGAMARQKCSASVKRRVAEGTLAPDMWKVAVAAKAQPEKGRKLPPYRLPEVRRLAEKGRAKLRRMRDQRTHCRRGHRYSHKTKEGYNRCVECERIREKRRVR